MDDLQKSIMATLIYYDIFDYPLSRDEVFNYLIKTFPRSVVAKKDLVGRSLADLIKKNKIDLNGDYYFLPNREYLIPLRKKKDNILNKKIKRTRLAVSLMSFLPFIKAVFASGSLATGSTDELSDLDVLVVVKHGRMWTARFLIVVLMSLVGIRRKPTDKIAPDKICLNHYITDKSLHIDLKSVYNAQTYSRLIPLLVREEAIVDEFKEKNKWVLDCVQKWNFNSNQHKRASMVSRAISFLFERALSFYWIGGVVESKTKNIQLGRIIKNPLTYKEGSKVVYCDERLEFHPDSPEKYIIKKYGDKLSDLGIVV
ncbi:MAG: hypothetical protein COV29_00445 [Candidatus Yanofskybacteria bacterium CG10_big_fil_rev_8_21_14_0_10_36_16]|uniref:Polymerase nucleotidyl transferase domain-containing protein n=1 Tax=Candidatus Yanofskybacteria bacterium CG10_big_fil_rev_8_21_14_0_10_36_16 TaxID=1975096 RepID=A0A2J0Q8B2_9BACT|nr:MAG: hypothetical protein COV29_00445 [Candidatus Yanofskybacteria bacterium CG10_big_fil_rev_8_21_14_0_10_36_16]